MSKKNIAVLMGGYSKEFDISLKSGNMVIKHLNKKKYNPYGVIIAKDEWYCNLENEKVSISKDDFSFTANGEKIEFDAVFNCIHGTPGEDGIIQAYFNLIKIPITGCSSYISALTFNKRDLLSVTEKMGIPCAKSLHLNKGDVINPTQIVKKLGLPCFVKANKSGSSFGISKVYDAEKLEAAIDASFEVDDEIIIEEYLQGVELSVGVIRYQGAVKVLPITEIVTQNDFFDYNAKYLGESEEITPARITDELRQKVNELASKLYTKLKLSGFTRSEFIVVNNLPHLLEINTTPGLSEASILPQQAAVAGISLEALFESALEEIL